MYFLMGGVSIGIFLNDLVLYHLKYDVSLSAAEVP